jgi:hypothetical protein
MAGIDKDSLNAFYYQIYMKGDINLEEYLQMVDVPKKNILLELVKKRQEDQAQQQIAQLQQEAQTQIQAITQQAQQLQAQNAELVEKNKALEQVLSPDEKKVHTEMFRQAAIASIEQQKTMENNGADEGQPENQGY